VDELAWTASWYRDSINDKALNKTLQDKPDGTFMIRDRLNPQVFIESEYDHSSWQRSYRWHCSRSLFLSLSLLLSFSLLIDVQGSFDLFYRSKGKTLQTTINSSKRGLQLNQSKINFACLSDLVAQFRFRQLQSYHVNDGVYGLQREEEQEKIHDLHELII
jgi:hypothetical protein